MARERIALGVGTVVVALIGVGLYLTLRDNAEPVGIDEAKERIASSTSLKGSAASRRPEPGVYRYEGSGTESLFDPTAVAGSGADDAGHG